MLFMNLFYIYFIFQLKINDTYLNIYYYYFINNIIILLLLLFYL